MTAQNRTAHYVASTHWDREWYEPLQGYRMRLVSLLDEVVATLSSDPAFKTFVMDEAWRFFQHPTIRNYVVEALKTWRKKNAAMILATQSLDELAKSDILHVVNESCPTKMFLANPEMDRAFYQETFHLNATELELIKGLIPKRQFLLKRPDYAKVLNLQVDRKSYWIYTNNPADNYKRDEAIAKYGFEEGLQKLAEGESL